MPSGFPNFRQIPSNYEVVMANRRAAEQSKMDATKQDDTDSDAQSLASSSMSMFKEKATKSSQSSSSGWRKRLWILAQERAMSTVEQTSLDR
ncbi:hypothetical protein TSTA_040970 [Talaromyces stipitatus ATCC 10500]|uniref:Uncharacterized protein n=1 Tax=Talaromyces stipitatus (strain ATCC 10500 / CBS 375.48 / QM 6759 / NRRL 1006) TaxID=441959 RepID=B8MID4_TALSN|nr:uncharacterized protein TSTA_040970 [Talaromyces stipitatus ATCC 10500]EED14618.1 hypothetical protein TSTA_040970 [Talaromyces stipitatus ATCC 10500]